MHYTAVGQADRASEIERAFLQSASAQSEGESWPAFAEYMRILLSKDGRLKKLKEFAGQNPRSADTARYLALAYKELGEDLAAAETFVIAAELEADSEKKIRLLGDAVDAAIGKHVDFAADALAKAKSIGEGNSDLAPSILSIEHSFSKARKEAGFEFASLERLLEMEPDDHSKRFELAYAYAEAGMGNMALFHYRLIPATAREDGVWNNLGAAYESQKLPIKAVNSYKKAEELGNTLAMSNLAYRFLHAGFLDEARKLCEIAVTLPEHHKNVDSALAAIKGALDAENDAEEKLISSAQDCSSFYRRVGTALLANGIADVLGKWKYEELELDVSIENGRFIATGVLEQNVLGLRRLHLGEHKPEIYDVSINGVLRGRAVQGFYEKKRRGSHSILGALAVEAKEDFLLCLSEDGETIEVMRGKGERRLGTMHRIVDGAKVISQPA
jgi:tetratricopeptide (TPR) repeat protein